MHAPGWMLVALLAAALPASAAWKGATPQDAPVVRAVLFFSPTCPHCEEVIRNRLPGIFEAHGGAARVHVDTTRAAADRYAYLLTNGRLQVLLIDASLAGGYALYRNATTAFSIRTDAVPRMVVGDSVLIGADEIPARFPGLIRRALTAGGLGWPNVPGLQAALATLPARTGERQEPVSGRTPAMFWGSLDRIVPARQETSLDVIPFTPPDRSLREVFMRDPIGNGLAVAVLALMGASLVAVPVVRRRERRAGVPGRLFPVLGVLGLGIATYLAWVEVTGASAACGLVGDCGTVHASPWARLFGVIPIGVAGVAGYVLLLGLWQAARREGPSTDGRRLRLLVVACWAATAFSAWLTLLEPFVIGATCLWCLGSALILTALLWLVAVPVWRPATRAGSP